MEADIHGLPRSESIPDCAVRVASASTSGPLVAHPTPGCPPTGVSSFYRRIARLHIRFLSNTRKTNNVAPSSFTRSTSIQLGIILIARDRMITMVKSEIVLSIIINILARRVSGKASVGLKAVAVLYPRYR